MILTLINSWDGTKMSGSKGNYIALVEDPNDQFGKTMRLPDDCWTSTTGSSGAGDPPREDPLEGEARLARFVVARAHGDEAARAAEPISPVSCARVRRRKRCPRSAAGGELVHLPALLVERLGIGSTSEARRLIAQGAVRLDGEPLTAVDVPRESLEGRLLQAGKRRFVRLTAA